jgi:nitrogen-specific signal transduction histidine kinase
MEAAHALHQSIIDGVVEPILVIGADYQVKLMNRAAREFSFGDAQVSKPLCTNTARRMESSACWR